MKKIEIKKIIKRIKLKNDNYFQVVGVDVLFERFLGLVIAGADVNAGLGNGQNVGVAILGLDAGRQLFDAHRRRGGHVAEFRFDARYRLLHVQRQLGGCQWHRKHRLRYNQSINWLEIRFQWPKTVHFYCFSSSTGYEIYFLSTFWLFETGNCQFSFRFIKRVNFGAKLLKVCQFLDRKSQFCVNILVLKIKFRYFR